MVDLNHPTVEEILYQLTEDWVRLTMIYALVLQDKSYWWKGQGDLPEDAIKGETLALLQPMLSEGLMVAGELADSMSAPNPFIDWPGEPAEIVSRIGSEWESLLSYEGFEPCWFRDTEAGLRIGLAIAKAEGRI